MSSSSYQMWLMRDQGASRIPFPILPETYQMTQGNRTDSIDIIGLGELTIRGDPAAMRVSFEGIFPVADDPDIEPYVPDDMRGLGPQMWKFTFDSFLQSADILQINIVGTAVNMHCYCSSYTTGEEGGDMTIHYQMEFTEYMESGLQVVSIDPATRHAQLPDQQPTRLDTRVTPNNVTVAPGQSLAAIAQSIYGSDDMVNAIVEQNRQLLENPMLVPPGITLSLPI